MIYILKYAAKLSTINSLALKMLATEFVDLLYKIQILNAYMRFLPQ